MEKYNTKSHITTARYPHRRIYHKALQYRNVFHMRKSITQNPPIPERVPNTEKYIMKFHNTRTHSQTRKNITQYHTVFHTWKNITQNPTIPVRVPQGKDITQKFTMSEHVPHTEKYNRFFAFFNTRMQHEQINRLGKFHTT